MTDATTHTHDAVLVGGGLANGLIALRLRQARPDLRLAIIEAGPSLGGNHTWSFHDTDVTPDVLAWLSPLIDTHWPDQEVRFPRRHRVLATGYNSISSGRLSDAVTSAVGPASIHLSARAADLRPTAVQLEDGRTFSAPLMIDGRGALGRQPLTLGFQKFIGHEVETVAPHGVARPVIMDATVAQHDGYRFVYLLPFSPTRILIEDTYYSDGESLGTDVIEARVAAYAAERGWQIASVIRREQGVLPITLDGDPALHWRTIGRDLPVVGLRAWLFHPTTGYSLPQAAALAFDIARLGQLHSAAVAETVIRRSNGAWSEQGFYRMLNRLLFVAARPGSRFEILERFYGLPQQLIERFYAGQATTFDKLRILTGKPPVSITRAVASLPPRSARDRADGNKRELNLG